MLDNMTAQQRAKSFSHSAARLRKMRRQKRNRIIFKKSPITRDKPAPALGLWDRISVYFSSIFESSKSKKENDSRLAYLRNEDNFNLPSRGNNIKYRPQDKNFNSRKK